MMPTNHLNIQYCDIALPTKRLPLLFANSFKSIKERQLDGKQYRKEAMNLTTKLIKK
jgi:hypothetical protein